jgi:hypothetical protein
MANEQDRPNDQNQNRQQTGSSQGAQTGGTHSFGAQGGGVGTQGSYGMEAGGSPGRSANARERGQETRDYGGSQGTMGRGAGAYAGGDTGEAMQATARYAREGGMAAWQTISSHPVLSAGIAALGAYLLFGRRSSGYSRFDTERELRRYRDMASDYADQARRSFGGRNSRDLMSTGRDLADEGMQVVNRYLGKEPLAAMVGAGLLAIMAASWLGGRR